MSQTKKAKFGFMGALMLAILIGIVGVVLVVLFPTRPPRVLEVIGEDSPVDPQIKVVFSDVMDKKSVENAFEINPPVEGKFSWSGKTMVFTPDENLKFSAEYSLHLDKSEVVSERGEKMDSWWKGFFTPDHSFFYLDENGVLNQYTLGIGGKVVSDENLFVKSFDYDPSLKRLLYVAAEREGFKEVENPRFAIYEVELIEHLKGPAALNEENPAEYRSWPIDYFEDNADYVIHFAKWLPFEEAVLVSRTKILSNQGFEYPSLHEEDRELILYDLKAEKERQLKTGNALLYEFFPTPDGKYVMLIDDAGSLIAHSLSNGEDAFLASDFLNHFGFSEYGGYLLYTILPAEGVFALGNDLVMKGQDGEEQFLLQGAQGVVDHPSLSPAEDAVAFKYFPNLGDAEAQTSYVLAIKDLADKDFDIFTNAKEGSVDRPQFSPDGRLVAFMFWGLDEENPWIGYDESERQIRSAPVRVFDRRAKDVQVLKIEASQLEWEY